jgi:hypothetical protein
LAHLLSERQAARVLVLTYNRALVADVRRLLTIMGIAPALAGQTVQIQTVHRFLAAALNALGFAIDGDADFAEAYERVKDEALAFLREGALDRDDLARLEGRDDTAFRWDYVFVDEAQDWPANERDLLFALFSPQRLVVADGVDQLVRTAMPTDWRVDLGADEVAVVPLRRCLRMKSGLARFASAVSRNLGLLYSEWIPNDEMGGGRVLIVDGPYLGDRAIHDRLVEANRSDGNRPVDMLVCVPPSQVAEDPSSGERRSLAAAVLERWGYRVWDGAAEDVREGYPTDADQVRIVQYESCRGLEGWVVVNLGLDRFFEHKRALATAIRGVDPALEAARWLTIPLSRAIDTLVIQLDAPSSPVADAIRAAASECADFVEYVMSR